MTAGSDDTDAPFRGGFRLVSTSVDGDGECVVEAWGSDLFELLARAMEGASHAAGGIARDEVGTKGDLKAVAVDEAGLIASLCATALARFPTGDVVSAARTRRIVHVRRDGVDGGVRLQADMELVLAPTESERRRLALDKDSVEFRQENELFIARFTLRTP